MRELENHLFSKDFDKWAKAQADDHREQIRTLRTKVYALRSQLQTHRRQDVANASMDSGSQLEPGLKDLRKKTYTLARLAELNELLDRMTCAVGTAT
jgi:capsule polysaccharide export protein KpsE/RkpR